MVQNIIAALQSDHNEIRTLFRQLEIASDDRKRGLLQQLVGQLTTGMGATITTTEDSC